MDAVAGTRVDLVPQPTRDESDTQGMPVHHSRSAVRHTASVADMIDGMPSRLSSSTRLEAVWHDIFKFACC